MAGDEDDLMEHLEADVGRLGADTNNGGRAYGSRLQGLHTSESQMFLRPCDERYLLSCDRLKLLYRRYLPLGVDPIATAASPRQKQPQGDNKLPKCVVCIVHGFGEHIGRYFHVIRALTAAGCDVHTIDLRGHGLSGGARADGRLYEFLEDLRLLHHQARLASPGLPVFLYGQSMGGLIVLSYAMKKNRPPIRGVIATSPWLRLCKHIQPPWWKMLMLRVFGPALREFLISSNVDPCSLSTVDGVAHRALHDRLVLPFLTIRMASEILHGASNALKTASSMAVPMLIIHGGRDTLTDPAASLQFHRDARSRDKLVRIFRMSFHEIQNDVERGRLFEEVNQWIDERYAVPLIDQDANSTSEAVINSLATFAPEAAPRPWYSPSRFLIMRHSKWIIILYLLIAWRNYKWGPRRASSKHALCWPLMLWIDESYRSQWLRRW